jgi:hypothetical protein
MPTAALPTQSNLCAVVKDDSVRSGQSVQQMLSAHQGTAVIVDSQGCTWFAPLVTVIDLDRACSDPATIKIRTIQACVRAHARGSFYLSDRLNTYAAALLEYASMWRPAKADVEFSR